MRTNPNWIDRIRVLTFLGTRIGLKGQDHNAAVEPRLRETRALLRARMAWVHAHPLEA